MRYFVCVRTKVPTHNTKTTTAGVHTLAEGTVIRPRETDRVATQTKREPIIFIVCHSYF
jgi:hypothetical protein